ncbi:MAG TPA: thiamine phosphate synthase [bacterium]|nr:thiamine phosphate synthase [bacterium]HOL46730.1 thiamine phosphate synthase [bacterium]HPQ18166.1 thiamine phosphate synthase [bacterium]
MNLEKFRKSPPELYVLTGTKFTPGIDHFQIITKVLEAGCKIIQMREKEMCDRDLFYFAKRLKELTELYGAYLIINDRIDIALAVNSDGVHLGQNDIPVLEARKILGPNKIIGLSTHSIFQALRAVENGVDYIGVGPIFETHTKSDVCSPVGTELIKKVIEYKEKINIPFYAIGGIKLENVKEVLAAGARNIAVVTGIITAKDVYETTKKFIETIKNYSV